MKALVGAAFLLVLAVIPAQAQFAPCVLFSTTLLGCVPASGGGVTNFLRADGTWNAPPYPAPLPTWTTVGRPSGGTPAAGVAGYNTSMGVVEIYNGTNWIALRPALTHQKYVVNNWYLSETGGSAFGNVGGAINADIIMCSYDEIITPVTINALGTTLTAAGTAAALIQFAMYSQDATSGRPGSLLANTGNVAATAVAAVNGTFTGTQVGLGTPNGKDIWFCFNKNENAIVPASRSSTNGIGQARIGSPTQNFVTNATIGVQGVSCTGAVCLPGASSTFGTWPASLAGSTWTESGTNQAPRIGFRAASSP